MRGKRDVFGFKHPKVPKEFWGFLLIAIILCIIFEDLWFYLALPIPMFSKYYINRLGTVPRWSPLHKKIEEYYAIALQNHLKNK